MLDSEINVSQRVVDVLVVLLWLPVVILLLGTSIAITALGIRTAIYGDLPTLSGASINPTLLTLAVGGGLAGLYLVLANVTFGSENVEAAADQGEDITESLDD